MDDQAKEAVRAVVLARAVAPAKLTITRTVIGPTWSE
jgi:hypothetical protein